MDIQIQAYAQIIAEKLNDTKAIRFHYMAVARLGSVKCFEILSIVNVFMKEGKIKKTPASLYNHMVMQEIKKKNEKAS